MKKKATREIRVGLDSGEPNRWRLLAECDDESTSMILVGEWWAGSRLTDAAELAGDLGVALVTEHLARCEACRRWAGGRHTAPSPGTKR